MINRLDISPEERVKYAEQAAATKEAAKAWATENLRNDFSDESHWRMLASKYSVRLPQWQIPVSESKYIRRTLKKLNLDNSWWMDQTGCTFKEFSELNPTWPAYACVGIVLETYDYEVSNVQN